MLAKIVGAFHFSLAILGTEVMSVSLFTDQDQGLGMGGPWDEDDDEDDGEDDGDDDPDPIDSMLDTLNEMVRWSGRG